MLESLEHEPRSGARAKSANSYPKTPQHSVHVLSGNLYRQLRRRTFDVCEIMTLGGDDIVRAR